MSTLQWQWRLSSVAVAGNAVLLLVVAAWQLSRSTSLPGWVWAVFSTLPLWLALAGLLRQRPGARAWTTLCAIPYVALGVTELIANPGARVWALGCVAIAFAWFVTLVLLLRLQMTAANSGHQTGR